jgi:hypothetical protein
VFLHRYRQILAQRSSDDRIGKRIAIGMLAINLIMFVLGVSYTAVANAFADDELKDRMENLLEWHIGLLMTGWYLLQAVLWKKTRYGFACMVETSR